MKAVFAFVVLAGLVAKVDVAAARDSQLVHHQHLARANDNHHSKAHSNHKSSSHKTHDSHHASHAKGSSAHANQSGSSHGSHNGWPGDDLLIVETNEGKLRGTYNHTSNVLSWLGVPFGEDTSGANRFMAPKHAKKYKGVRDATDCGPSCPQHGSPESRVAAGLFGLSTDIFDQKFQSEDCLNLNVQIGRKTFEKFKHSNGKKKAAVWLNFYGGSYEWGSNRLEMYSADTVVNHDDVVVVNANFRNWIFGYPLAPQLHPKENHDNDNYSGANPGLKDIDLAIEWVYKNIEHFGGDPNRITIGGTSTGASSVDNWAYAHYNKPTAKQVAGIILQSGSMTSLGRYFLAGNNETFKNEDGQWNKVAKHVGCGTGNDKKQFRCMQRKPWKEIMAASFATKAKFSLAIDNVTTFNNYFDRLQQRRFVDVPMLIGNNKDEGNAFLIHQADATQFLGPIITAEVWVCPASVQAHIREGVAPTWRYRFSPSFYIPGTPKKYRELLTYHGSDTSYAWGTWKRMHYIEAEDSSKDPNPVITVPVPTDNDKVRGKIASVYREANVQFVKDPQNGLRNFHGGWPEYKKGSATVGDIGYNNDIEHPFRLINSWEIDGVCPLTDIEVNLNNMKYKPGFQKVRSYLV